MERIFVFQNLKINWGIGKKALANILSVEKIRFTSKDVIHSVSIPESGGGNIWIIERITPRIIKENPKIICILWGRFFRDKKSKAKGTACLVAALNRFQNRGAGGLWNYFHAATMQQSILVSPGVWIWLTVSRLKITNGKRIRSATLLSTHP